MKHYDVVAMSMLEHGKIKIIYALIMLYDSYSVALNSVLLTPENLPQKKQIAGSIGLDTIVLTNYLKKHYNYIMSQLNLRCVATHYITIKYNGIVKKVGAYHSEEICTFINLEDGIKCTEELNAIIIIDKLVR